MKLVMWSFGSFDQYSDADFAGRVITLVDDTTEFCISSDTVDKLNVGLSTLVEMFIRMRTFLNDDSYVLSLIDNNNVEKFSYNRENNTWVLEMPDAFKNINVSEVNRRIADIEKWVGEAYQPNDEVGLAIEAIKKLAKV